MPLTKAGDRAGLMALGSEGLWDHLSGAVIVLYRELALTRREGERGTDKSGSSSHCASCMGAAWTPLSWVPMLSLEVSGSDAKLAWQVSSEEGLRLPEDTQLASDGQGPSNCGDPR